MARIRITGGEAIARMVQAFDGGPIFGMGGFQLLPFYDAARRLGLAHHLINDERAGVFAADAYAKLTNRVGLVDATLGPGATNLVTGLVEALNAGTPLVGIVGDTHRDHSWKNMTQECRQVDILRPAVKDLIEVQSPARIPELVRRAFAEATSGRPGPVLLDVPEDVSHAEWDYDESEFHAATAHMQIPAYRSLPSPDALAKAAALIGESERPILLVGGGIHLSGAYDGLIRFAERAAVPVAHTMTGKGAIPCTHPLSAGLFGRYDRIANGLIDESDLIIVVGCKLGEIATKRYTVPAPSARVLHIDVVPEELGRTREIDLGVVGDAQETLSALCDLVPPAPPSRLEHAATIPTRMSAWWRSAEDRTTDGGRPIGMARLMAELNDFLPDESVLIADGGFAAHWGALLLDTRKAGRRFVPDRGFASIGYGLPAAIGASIARPGSHVVALTGDGGFNMMLGEMETARRLGTHATIVVVNNAASGYVKALQHLMYGEGSYHASDLCETDYAAIATAMGCFAIRVEDPDELQDALVQAQAAPGLSVLDVVVTRDPGKMLPGVDSRAVQVAKGDRIA